MKPIRILPLALLAASLFAAAAARAAGPEAADIAVDAKGYLHFDTSLIRESALLKTFRNELGASNPVDKALEQISMAVGLNLLEDMDGITFYTTTFKEGEGVLLIYGKTNENEVLRHIENFPEHTAQAYGEHKIHTWFDQGRNATVAGLVSDKMIMWADNAERLKAALDVLDGKKPGRYAPALDYPKGALFGAATNDMPAFAKKPDQQIFLLAKSLEVSLSEEKESLTATITAGMADAEQAGQVKQVADGLKAFMALNQAKMPEVAKLVALIKTETDGATAKAILQRPTSSVFADINKIKSATEGKGK